MDPLSLLREFERDGRQAQLSEDGTSIVFDDQHFPRKTPTRYKSNNGGGDPYALEALWFYLAHAEEDYSRYFQLCSEKAFERVGRVDVKHVLAYLRGDKNEDEIGAIQHYPVSVGVKRPAEGEESAAKRRKIEEKADEPKSLQDIAREIAEKEVWLRNRHSILQSNSKKNFSDFILKLVEKARQAEEAKNLADQEAKKKHAQKKSSSNTRYNFNAEDIWKDKGLETEEFNIETAGSFIPGKAPEQPKPQTPTRPVAAEPKKKEKKKERRRRDGGVPIIICPKNFTSVLTLLNIQDFLQENTFVPTAEKRSAGMKEPTSTIVLRKRRQQQSVPYKVINDVHELTKEDWDQVVAIITGGKGWEFKSYPDPYKQPVGLFSKVCGFYFHFDDVKPKGEVLDWDVTLLPVSKTKRHSDVTIVKDFWEKLDMFIRRRKPHLTF